MTCQSLTFLVPGIGPAGLPLPLSAQVLPEPEPPVHQPDAAETEPACWTPDPGSIEFASWTAHMWASVR